MSVGGRHTFRVGPHRCEPGDRSKSPPRAAFYTSFAYAVTVALLIIPYIVVSNYFISLGWTLAHAVLIIAAFSFYISVIKSDSFRHRFGEMCGLSLGVAGLSFVIGFLVRRVLGVEV